MNSATTRKARNRGFTLIEVMAVVIIASILTAVALPFYRSFILNQRIKTASFDVMSLLIYTRSEAMKRNADVTLSNIGTSSALTVTLSGGTKVRESSPLIGIKVDCMDTSTNPATSMNCPAGLTYNSSGRVKSTFPPVQLYAIPPAGGTLPDTTASHFRCVTIGLSGVPYSKKGPC